MPRSLSAEVAPRCAGQDVTVTGQTILHYEIREVLGEGSMGVVYKALDRKLDRLVALKFLPAHLAPLPDRVDRFLQEATALSVVNHPHIATIYDIEEVNQQRFLVLEYLPGGTLKTRIERVQQSQTFLSLDFVVEYARQTAEGLAHAHRRGIVHRDVKTSNLMLTEEGNVKITDFGVAKLSRFGGRTIPGSLIGTIRYMSPEQAQGMEADARSDIFSFGVVLFELTTGRVPFEAENEAALLLKIVSSPAPSLSTFRSDVPKELERIVGRALMKRPEDRYQTADELAVDLQELGHRPLQPPWFDTTETSSTIGPATTLSSFPGRRAKIWAGALFALFFFLMAGLYYTGHELPHWIRFPKLPSEKRLAVLPFRNLGGATDDAFCAGLFEILGSKLGQIEQLQGGVRVISTAEVLKERVGGAREARNAFGATLTVTGSLLRSRDKVVVVTELVDTNTQLVLDSRNVEASAADLTELQDKLVDEVTTMLRLNVQPEARRAITVGLTRISGAFEAYSQGRGYLQRYDRAENVTKALDSFDKALALDPQFALAYAGRAEAYLRRFQDTRDGKYLELARISGRRGIELNDQLSAVHLTMGLIHNSAGEYQDAIIRFESALKLQPGSAEAYRELANAYASAGRFENADATYRRAIQLRPDDWTAYKDLGVFLNVRGRLEDAVYYFKRVIELTPDNYAGYANLGGLYLRLGNYPKAQQMLRRSLEINPTGQAYLNLGVLYYFKGEYPQAAEMFQKGVELNPADAQYWGNLGDAYRWIPGKKKESEDAFRQAIAVIEKELAVNPRDGRKRANLARFWSAIDNREMALKELSLALQLNRDDPYILSRAAYVYEQSEMREAALTAVQDAVKGGFSIEEFQRWPSLADLRQDPRYQQLIDNRAKDQQRSAIEPR